MTRTRGTYRYYMNYTMTRRILGLRIIILWSTLSGPMKSLNFPAIISTYSTRNVSKSTFTIRAVRKKAVPFVGSHSRWEINSADDINDNLSYFPDLEL